MKIWRDKQLDGWIEIYTGLNMQGPQLSQRKYMYPDY